MSNNRNTNFDLLRRYCGYSGHIAKRSKLFSPSTESLIALGKRELSDYEAREIEKKFELATGWFDIDHETIISIFKNPNFNSSEYQELSENSKKLLNAFLKSIKER